MTNSYRVAEPAACDSCEDFGLTYDLVSSESVLISKSVANSTSHLNHLATTIESAIIPRLLVNHGVGLVARDRIDGVSTVIDGRTIAAFVHQLISQDNSEGYDFVEELLGRGVPMERVLLELMAPAARLMGEMWTADQCSFVDVTLGLSRIQQMLRQFRNLSDGQRVAAENKGRALLVPAPGEQHTFGLRVVEEFLLRDGWEVRSNLRASHAEMVQLVSEDDYDFVGFSLSGERLLAPLVSAIGDIRRRSRNRSLRVMVGGVAFAGQPDLAKMAGADVSVSDARDAVLQANEWCRAAQVN